MAKTDGYLKIKTKLDNNGIDKDVAELENKINKLETKNAEYSQEQSSLENEINNYEKLKQKAKEYKQKLTELKVEKEAMRKANPTLAVSDTPEYANIKQQIAEIKQQYVQVNAEIDKQSPKIDKVADKLEKVKAKQAENNTKITQFKDKIEAIKVDKIKNGMDNVGKSIKKQISSITKMSLAIFGVRTAIGLVSSAVGILSQYNPQLAVDIEYIRYAVANVLLPVIERIVSFVATLLSYINAITYALFGWNLFSSAKEFSKMKSSAEGTAKATKEIGKSLQGFDEKNVLQDNSSSSANSNNTNTSSFDLALKEVELPSWMQKIIDFFKEIIEKHGAVAGGIMIVVGALAGFTILKTIIGLFTQAKNPIQTFTSSFGQAINTISKLGGAALILLSLSEVIKEITNLIDVFSDSGLTLGEVAGLIGIVLGELTVAFIAFVGAAQLLDWTSIAGIAIILASISIALSQINKLLKTLSSTGMSATTMATTLGVILAEIVVTMTALTAIAMVLATNPMALVGLVAIVGSMVALLLVVKETLPTILEACSKFINSVAPILIELIQAIYVGIESLITALGVILPPIINSVGEVFNSIFNGIDKVVSTVGNTIIRIMETAKDLVDGVLKSILTFINELGRAVNNFVDNCISAVTKLINFMISAIEYLANLVVQGLNGIISGVNSVSKYVGIYIPRVSTVYIPRFIPKLAKGGVVAQPTMAVIGEAGKEAVIPLENNLEYLDYLADKISSKIGGGNSQVNVYLDGRLIQRQMSKRRQELVFATNGRQLC